MEELHSENKKENIQKKLSTEERLHQDQVGLDRLGSSVHLHPDADPQFIYFAQSVLKSYHSIRAELIQAYHDTDDDVLDKKIEQLQPILHHLESDVANDGSLDEALSSIRDLFHNIPTE